MTPQSAQQRFHHLDALRAFAMLLGLVIHAVMSFIAIPVWPAQDIYQNDDLYGFLLHGIHGFRMPLFFLISGFFTTLLWKRRGVKGLLKNRAIRILVPLAIGTIVLAPVMIGLSIWGGTTKETNATSKGVVAEGATIWSAAKEGDTEYLTTALDDGAIPNEPDSSGITPLAWAAMTGEIEAMNLLLEHGADVNARGKDGNTPLHGAAFLGRHNAVTLLLKNGALPDPQNQRGETPLDNTRTPWEVVKWISGMLKVEVSQDEVMSGREKVFEMLEAAAGATEDPQPDREESGFSKLVGIWTFGSMIPVFHHLWFLYYLCLLVTLFLLFAPLMSRLPARVSKVLTGRVVCWFWLVPLTFAAQFLMRQSFGPDTATGILPWLPKLFYYAIFFGFGVMCFGKETFEQRAGKFWPIHFLLALPVLLAALYFFEDRSEDFATFQSLYSLFAALYAWLMIFGFIGVFRRFFSAENSKIRYLSDSAYWLYLAHLPLVIALQILVSGWDFPGPIKLLGILIVMSALLLLTYEWFVRYTWIGAILNGRKTSA